MAETKTTNTQTTTHRGGCHCGAIKFRIEDFETEVTVWKCNCSICDMKQNHHIIVPKSKFVLESGEDCLTTYTFNTHAAKHTFCKICGVQSFYTPRSNPDGFGVTYYCLDQSTITKTIWKGFDGQNWEDYINKSGIQGLSKE
mmetsp:Transcript_30778/g.35037  ORF Transcript_30778/g.35037 Transcript_30778/m.35037 type:complete len:142 (+) Transcript_30778:55-480(+)